MAAGLCASRWVTCRSSPCSAGEVVLTDAVTAVASLLRPSWHRLDPFIA
jgi:hypothetical protein